jgi:hypothetical protein
VRSVGLFDFLRGKQDEDPILGGRSAEPSGLEVTPVEGGAWSRTSTQAGGDPERLAAELRERFPGARIDVQQQSLGGVDPAQMARAFFAGGTLPAPDAASPAADPIAQIERLAELHRSGALTDDEFAAAKAKLLGS